EAFSLNPTTVRLVFPTNTLPQVGQTIDMEFLDAAGNTSGVITRAIAIADAVEPGLDDVAAVSVAGVGGDYLEIDWNESMDLTTALDLSNYAISTSAGAIDLTGAETRYFSDTQTVRISLPVTVDLDTALTVDFSISGVADATGNTLSGTAQLSKAVSGDMVPPSIENAFANLRFDATGRTVDVLFDEDIDETFVTTVLFWSTSGAANVTAVEALSSNRVRLTLDAALLGGDTISLGTGLEDAAGNAQTVANPLSIEPVL
ncbi:MAG: Ig-like domain-containing protein, partial [Planctomycetota bacterium]